MAVDLPAPENPVITTKSCSRDSNFSSLALARAARCSPRGLITAIACPLWRALRTPGERSVGSAGAVQVPEQLPAHLRGHAGHGRELLAGGRHDRLRRAEVRQQRALARGADPGQLVEQRARHRLVAAGAVVGYREPMRLVAHALQQLQL